ncbi:hypothetical protein OROGR_011938 [Orobanche gracilis]
MKLLHIAVLILVVSYLSAAILVLRVNYDLAHHEVDLPLGNSSIKPPIQYLRYKPRHWAARYWLRPVASTRYQLPHTPIQYLSTIFGLASLLSLRGKQKLINSPTNQSHPVGPRLPAFGITSPKTDDTVSDLNANYVLNSGKKLNPWINNEAGSKTEIQDESIKMK